MMESGEGEAWTDEAQCVKGERRVVKHCSLDHFTTLYIINEMYYYEPTINKVAEQYLVKN